MLNSQMQSILDRLELARGYGVFWIGRRATRLTFLSQQQRALNLVWALSSEGRLTRESQIAVVGAGLAGLTSAFAAHQLGVPVTIFESKSVALHLQRGSELRFIHPNILDWPAIGSEALLTDLPCMNWGADMASRVSNTVLEEWISIEGQLDVNYECEVRSIDKDATGRHMLLAEGKGRNIVRAFDLVILAVGFGLERPLPGLPLLSYWENDNYGRPIVTGSLPRSYLVTGCGDGGLIDAIRLRINAFDHADFVYRLQRLPDIELIKKRLPEIDKEVQREISTATRGPQAKDEDEGVLLERKYRELEIPASLKDLLTDQLREDTIVYLNSPNRTPYSLKASILNRFLAFLLREYGGLRYRAGKVEVTAHPPPHGFGVACLHPEFPAEHFHVHEMVVRHGPIPVIDKLFPKAIAEDCRSRPDDVDDPTRHAMYPKDFLARRDLLERKGQVAFDYSLSNAVLASRGHFNSKLHNRFGVETQPSSTPPVRYFIGPHGAEGSPAARDARFYEFPVVVDRPASVPKANPTTKRRARRSAGRPGGVRVSIGMGIAVGDQQGSHGRGTLGCFVRDQRSGEIALLTAGYVLKPDESPPVDSAVYRANAMGSDIGASPIAQVTRVVRPVASAPRATIAAGNVILNEVDAGIAVLSPAVQRDMRLRKEGRKYMSLRPNEPGSAADLIGERVFKIGSSSGLTSGLVTQVAVVLNIGGGDEGSIWYRGLFCVEGVDGASFSAPGDGGALVLREDGTPLGILLLANGQQTFVGPLAAILSALDCDLVLREE